MASGLSNQPKFLKGAFVDSNIVAIPPLIVPFQFNPDTITRQRSATARSPKARVGREHQTPASQAMGEAQTTLTQPETISMNIRLDATDAMENGDSIAGEVGVLPALSALELMITPRASTVLGGLLRLSANLGFGDRQSTPVIIFVWGRQRIYPVRITSLNIQEMEYNVNLNPTRVTVSTQLQVLEGTNPFYLLTQLQREVLAAINLANVGELKRSIINPR